MKFHHLARHNQFAGAHQQRDASPSKQQRLQAASIQKQQQHQLNNLTDDEDDDFNESQSFYEPIEQQQHHLLNALQGQQVAAAAAAVAAAGATGNNHGANNGNAAAATVNQQQQQQQIDTSGFLMDKNKKLFPQKLWELIHSPSIQHCLRWSQDGQRVYLNRNEFEAYYLKTPNNQFHTQKAISFVRQMNMYGFRKVDDCYYENDNFRRDRQHLLRNMIRRHPNKGLFVGLDHHQLAAATAAQQALQVNQQLQQLEQQHKQRAEQALRLNNYLNNHHHHQQFHHHQSAALAHHQLHHHHHHSLPLEHMSSQLAQAAANHLSQQQQQLHQQHIQHQQLQSQDISASGTAATSTTTANNIINNNNNLSSHQLSSLSVHHNHLNHHHQPKKSRLLNNFYALAAPNNNNNNNNNSNNNNNNNNSVSKSSFGVESSQLMHNQDSMHSTSSVDTEPSQCSSANNSGSAGSPQPNSPTALQQRFAAMTNHRNQHHQPSASSIRAAVLAAAAAAAVGQDPGSMANKFGATNNCQQQQQQQQQLQHAATDLSSQSLANRQALHQTLVRSLLQLKHHQQNNSQENLLLSLQQQQQQQQQNPRSLLESLASLSSAGTGSIVDPTSNSPTERTSTPPSSPTSPSVGDCVSGGSGCEDATKYNHHQYLDSNNMALDLAKSSHTTANGSFVDIKRQLHDFGDALAMEAAEETELEGEEEDDEVEDKLVGTAVGSPLDETKKVRRFLDNQMSQKRSQKEDKEEGVHDKEHGKDEEESGNLEADERLVERKSAAVAIKRESISPLDPRRATPNDSEWHHQKKKLKLSNGFSHSRSSQSSGRNSSSESLDGEDLGAISKSLIIGICDRLGNQLDVPALQEAARYTECFLEILLEDAALIARHSSYNDKGKDEGDKDKDGAGDNDDAQSTNGKITSEDRIKESELKTEVAPLSIVNGNSNKRGSLVDASSLSLALKLIPSKLIAAIQQQVNLKSRPTAAAVTQATQASATAIATAAAAN